MAESKPGCSTLGQQMCHGQRASMSLRLLACMYFKMFSTSSQFNTCLSLSLGRSQCHWGLETAALGSPAHSLSGCPSPWSADWTFLRFKSGSYHPGEGQPPTSPSPLRSKVQNNRHVVGQVALDAEVLWVANFSWGLQPFPRHVTGHCLSPGPGQKGLAFPLQLRAQDCLELRTIPFVPASGWLLKLREWSALSSLPPLHLYRFKAPLLLFPRGGIGGKRAANPFQPSGSRQNEGLMSSLGSETV